MIDAIDLIGVPLDLGVKELGLKLGPDAFREIGLSAILRQAGLDVHDAGNIPQPILDFAHSNNDYHTATIAAYCKRIAEIATDSIRAGRVPVCLGGDHSLAIGSVTGVAAAAGPVGCLWLDAHPDANTPETSPSGNIHGMPLAILLGCGPEKLVELGPPGGALTPENVSIIGSRDMDPGEVDFLAQRHVQMFTVFDVLEQGLPTILDRAIERVTSRTRGVHISLDLDVLHQDVAPGVGLPSQCGFDVREAMYLCRRISAECRVTSVDIVGLNPVRDHNWRTARLAVELLMVILGKPFSFSYCGYLKEQRS